MSAASLPELLPGIESDDDCESESEHEHEHEFGIVPLKLATPNRFH
jgi:hypothetical protein